MMCCTLVSEDWSQQRILVCRLIGLTKLEKGGTGTELARPPKIGPRRRIEELGLDRWMDAWMDGRQQTMHAGE
jgi:hypothetical protein